MGGGPVSAPVAVFAYGSLMFEPECPEAVLEVLPARLPRWRRAFNKRSRARGCLASEARWPVRVTGFVEEGRHLSLALGTEPDPGAVLEGAVIRYADARVLEHLDLREGYDPVAPGRSAYLRETVQVEVDGGHTEAWTYLTNPSSALYVGDLDREDTIRVLRHATPRVSERALGIDYLLGVHRALGGRPDPTIDALVSLLGEE